MTDFENGSAVERMRRPHALTPGYLRNLPYLLPLAVVIEITGLTKHGVQAAVDAGSLRRWRVGASRKAKYYRDEVFRLIAVDVNQIRPHTPDTTVSAEAGSTSAGPG